MLEGEHCFSKGSSDSCLWMSSLEPDAALSSCSCKHVRTTHRLGNLLTLQTTQVQRGFANDSCALWLQVNSSLRVEGRKFTDGRKSLPVAWAIPHVYCTIPNPSRSLGPFGVQRLFQVSGIFSTKHYRQCFSNMCLQATQRSCIWMIIFTAASKHHSSVPRILLSNNLHSWSGKNWSLIHQKNLISCREIHGFITYSMKGNKQHHQRCWFPYSVINGSAVCLPWAIHDLTHRHAAASVWESQNATCGEWDSPEFAFTASSTNSAL